MSKREWTLQTHWLCCSPADLVTKDVLPPYQECHYLGHFARPSTGFLKFKVHSFNHWKP